MRNTVSELQGYFCPFGYLDIRAVCKIGDDLDMSENELFDIINDFRESIGSESWDSIDPVYWVLDHVMQEARSKISEVTGYDFINDFSGAWTEIYVHGNFMCSSFDYSENAVEDLKDNISMDIAELVEDKFCKYLFEQLNIWYGS